MQHVQTFPCRPLARPVSLRPATVPALPTREYGDEYREACFAYLHLTFSLWRRIERGDESSINALREAALEMERVKWRGT